MAQTEGFKVLEGSGSNLKINFLGTCLEVGGVFCDLKIRQMRKAIALRSSGQWLNFRFV